MGSIDLPDVDRKIIENCNSFLWEQKVIDRASIRILEDCENEEEIEAFFTECENNIKELDTKCKIGWNLEIQRFRGDEFGYVFYFYSDVLSSPIKIAIKIDAFDRTIILGDIEIASRKEKKKLDKHIEQQQQQPPPTTPQPPPTTPQPPPTTPQPPPTNLNTSDISYNKIKEE